MNNDALQKMFSLLPEGERKNKLLNKFNQMKKSKNKSGGGLQDEMSLKPSGHIMIEEIDADGKSLGVLADQPNLVVNGSEEIMLRALSGDPKRTLYKNRKLKEGKTQSEIFHVKANELFVVEAGNNVIPHNPNDLWKVVNDADFDYEFSYYPNTLYVKEETSSVTGEKAFRIVNEASASTAPISSEIYSGYTNMFIGLGDGKNYAISLEDERITYTGTFTGDEARKATTTVNDEISFTEKMTNFEVHVEKSNKGGQIEVYVKGALKETIETYDSSLADGETEDAVFTYEDLNKEEATEIRLKFSGSDTGISSPVIAVKGLKWDVLTKDMNNLVHEFENHIHDFSTPMAYNTTTTAPYMIQLDHFPVEPGSVAVDYNGALTEVESLEEIEEGTFYVEEKTGAVHFNRALTNLFVTYSKSKVVEESINITSSRVDKGLTEKVVDVPVREATNGSQRMFTFVGSEVISVDAIKVDGEVKEAGTDYTVNSTSLQVTFDTAPAEDSVVTVDFTKKRWIAEVTLSNMVDDAEQLIVQAYDATNDEVIEEPLTKVSRLNELAAGAYMIEPDMKTLYVSYKHESLTTLANIVATYESQKATAIPTHYRRQVILKPKDQNEYPWFSLDKGQIEFVAEFGEDIPNHNVTIREMGLFDGPRVDDEIKGFKNDPVRAFSLVRVGESRKNVDTGLRVTWTITLMDENGNAFQGGK